MPDQPPDRRTEVDRFILNRIDSVPHLEALLLLSRNRDVAWSVEQVAKRLWVPAELAESILKNLVRQQLVLAIAAPEEQYRYNSELERDRLLQDVEAAYAREMIRISTMIHSKASSAIREFARAFRFKKEQE